MDPSWVLEIQNASILVLRGSGYLGYVDSNQGYNPYKWVVCPLSRVINLHITSYLPYPEPLSKGFTLVSPFFSHQTLNGT